MPSDLSELLQGSSRAVGPAFVQDQRRSLGPKPGLRHGRERCQVAAARGEGIERHGLNAGALHHLLKVGNFRQQARKSGIAAAEVQGDAFPRSP